MAALVATAVPGMKDILVLGKVKGLESSRAADLIIVDAPAAGHAITFLTSARGLLDAVRVGPIRTQAERCGRFVPAAEAEDLARALAFRAERHRLQRAQVDRLADRLPLPRIELPFVFAPDITRAQLDVVADAFTAGVAAL